MSEKKKTAIILGGTIPHKVLVENLKERGYYTILIDYLDNPPAKASAHEHLRESTLDKEKVLEIARSKNAELVISTSVDQANVTACYVAEELGLPSPYTYKTALTVTNKILMKKKMKEHNIPTSNFIKVDCATNIDKIHLNFPVVIKPADSTGSKGVRKVENLSNLKSHIGEAFSISRSGEVIIEEFIDGKEIQVDFFVQNSEVRLVLTREKIKIKSDKDSVLQSIGSLVPANISQKVYDDIQEIAKKIVHAFNLRTTSLFIQAIVDKDAINVIEFACRIGGGLSFSMIKIITGFDILNATVDTFLGVQSIIKCQTPTMFYSTNLIYTLPGKFGKILGFQELLRDKIIEQFYIFKTEGSTIGSNMTSGDRVGAFLIKAPDRVSLVKKIREAFQRVSVYDENGQNITRTDIIEKLILNE